MLEDIQVRVLEPSSSDHYNQVKYQVTSNSRFMQKNTIHYVPASIAAGRAAEYVVKEHCRRIADEAAKQWRYWS